MNSDVNHLHSSLPSNKFYPPHINESQSIIRSNLIDNIATHRNNNKIIAIEAQAGQGKTTLAYQLVTHNKYKHIWYQIGKEDSDPVLLLTGLLHNLNQTFQDFTSPQLSEIIKNGEIGPLDLTHCVNILLNDINQFLHHDLYIVFDDLHLIEDAPLTNDLLGYIFDTSPPRLHFVLTSRHPFEIKSKTIRSKSGVTYLNTQDLALSAQEIETLFNDVFKKNISVTDVRKILDATNGWVMGIVLTAHPMAGGKTLEDDFQPFIPQVTSSSQKELLEYCQDEIFNQIPKTLHKPLLQLSFIDEIHVDLAEAITAIQDIEEILKDLTHENLFIYNLDVNFRVFRFHHLFQEFLQVRAEKLLDTSEIKQVYSESASFFLNHDMIDKALSCYLQGGDYEKMNELLHRYGLDILAQNRTLTILNMLQSIPEDTLLQYGWLTLFSGILGGDFQPQKTLPHLESARNTFNSQGEDIGELLALAQIIYYHFVVSGMYNTGAGLLPRTEELLLKHKEGLSKHVIIMVKRNLAAGFCFFSSDMSKARYYIEQARETAIEYKIRNFMASTVFIQAYIELLSGNRTQFRREVEYSHSLMNDQLVGMSNKLTLRVLHICSLSMYGDIANYYYQQQLIRNSIDEKVVKGTIAAPYFFVWGASCFISIGESEKALDLIERGVDVSTTAKSSHMRSQLLQWHAYLSVLHGNKKKAEELVTESINLRKQAGGPFYESFNRILAGAVYGRLKKKRLAKESFSIGLTLAKQVPSPYLQAACYLHNSYFSLTTYGEKTALEHLRSGLTIMQEHDYDHFWSWEPGFTLQLLTLAVKEDIQKDFAKALARKRLKVEINDDGTIIPLLHINVLDGFRLSISGSACINIEQLTPLQRELIGQLLIAKDKKISQEKIQVALWPESSSEKSRKKFDTLLGRLRNTFTEHLSLPVADYIVLNKGILSFENTTTDIENFFTYSELGYKHVRQNEYWQAGNHFYQALSLWNGTLPSDTFTNESIYDYEENLLRTFENTCLQWTDILIEAGRYSDAIPILEKLLRICRHSEHGIVSLCKIYSQLNQPRKARDVLNRYKNDLRNLDYQAEEIEQMINDIIVTLNNS